MVISKQTFLLYLILYMNTNIDRMLIGSVLFVSMLMTLCLCLYVDERHAIYHEDEQEIKVAHDVDVKVKVDTAEPLSHIEEYFMSFTIDCQEFSENFEKMNFR